MYQMQRKSVIEPARKMVVQKNLIDPYSLISRHKAVVLISP